MILLIDNYDSFTWNLVHYLGDLGAQVSVHRNDAISVADALALRPSAVVIGPGPCDPDRAGICLDLTHALAEARIPMLGVCLGHQTIGQAFGGQVLRAPQIVHGKMGQITHHGAGVFAGLASPLQATRYHSLVVDRASLPECLEITATDGDLIMGLRHRDLPIEGVQFHPESIRTLDGHAMLQNFLNTQKVAA